jgi:acetyltransferase
VAVVTSGYRRHFYFVMHIEFVEALLMATEMLRVRAEDTNWIPGLAELLMDSVSAGASLGFLKPLQAETANHYWEGVLAELSDLLILWIAIDAGNVVGTVQLALSGKQNGKHRGEVNKLMVHTSARNTGVARQLMAKVEEYAASHGRHLLHLDTQAGSPAETVYQRLGWQRVGEIPDFAASPEGVIYPTAIYYKRILTSS